MQATLSQSNDTRSSLVSLGQNHGYRFEGDTAILNAELAFVRSFAEETRASTGPLSDQGGPTGQGEHWALQLWACETPHQGGPLRGIKVAEAALALPQQGEHDYLEASAFAQLPPAQRAYSMVLVLASGSAGTYDQVHDFSNYPARQQFAAPHLEGSVGYRFEDDALVLQAEGVRNPRAEDNLSGSLSLQLWALREPYAGGAFEGVLLGSAELERLAGQSEEHAIERRVARAQAPEGEWQLALMLREWTEAAGYLTRDFCNFADAYRVESTYGAQPAAVETYRAQSSDEPPFFAALDEQPRNENGAAAAQHDDGRASEAEADAGRLAAAQRAEEQARQGDLAARAEETARAELAARTAALKAREEEAARAAASTQEQERAREQQRARAADQARQDEAARAEASARAEANARAEQVARDAEAAERATAATRDAAETERASALARAATARADAEAEAAARAAMAQRAGKPAPVAKTTRSEAGSAAKPTATASGNGAKKVAPQAVAAPSEPRAREEAPRASTAVRVSVQTASVDELAGVPGLNKKLAAAIVRARPFNSLDDLRQVRGIGDKMLQQLRSSLTL